MMERKFNCSFEINVATNKYLVKTQEKRKVKTIEEMSIIPDSAGITTRYSK
jgi:hypothetical protein